MKRAIPQVKQGGHAPDYCSVATRSALRRCGIWQRRSAAQRYSTTRARFRQWPGTLTRAPSCSAAALTNLHVW